MLSEQNHTSSTPVTVMSSNCTLLLRLLILNHIDVIFEQSIFWYAKILNLLRASKTTTPDNDTTLRKQVKSDPQYFVQEKLGKYC